MESLNTVALIRARYVAESPSPAKGRTIELSEAADEVKIGLAIIELGA